MPQILLINYNQYLGLTEVIDVTARSRENGGARAGAAMRGSLPEA